MTSLVLERDPVAVRVSVSDEHIAVELDDGRSISVPLAWYPRLLHATPEERSRYEFWGRGYAIEWPAVDEHISIEGLLAGRRSGESPASFDRWLKTRTRPDVHQ